jgi:cold shock CspA family protein
MRGRIDKVIRARGFGFIRAEDGRQVYFHRISLLRVDFQSLEEGQTVDFELQHGEFDLHPGEKALRAATVRLQSLANVTQFALRDDWALM